MDSKSLKIYGFVSWIEYFELKENEGKDIPEKERGIYVFKLDKKFGRLFGESDILYIGHAKDLKDKIYNEYILGKNVNKETKTSERIYTYLRSRYLGKVKVSWIKVEEVEKLIKKELELLSKTNKELINENELIIKLIIELIKELIIELVKKLAILIINKLKEEKNKLKDSTELENSEELIRKLINRSDTLLNKVKNLIGIKNLISKDLEELINKRVKEKLEESKDDIINEIIKDLLKNKNLKIKDLEIPKNLDKFIDKIITEELENLELKGVYERKLREIYKERLLEEYEKDHHELPPWNRKFR